ncbi:MAG: LysR family transcriptional regulator [Limosilactobacillus gorillae]|nr:LysR family transcriptional regulator [Limosilactobacillus gorillae]
MDFTRLSCFCDVVETGSFQQAAKKEFVTQRAVSQSIKRLEDELGLTLFNRSHNKIQITPVGHQFYLQVSDMLAKFKIDVNDLRYQQRNAARQLTVGYFSPFEGSLLRDQLFDYIATSEHQLDLKITHEGVNHLLADVSAGLVDLATVLDYGSGLNQLNNGLVSQTIFEGEMLMGVSVLSQWQKANSFPIADAPQLPVLYYTSEDSHYLRDSFLATVPKSITGIRSARIANIEQMQMLVAMNKAVAFYPSKLYKRFLPDNEHIRYLPISGLTDQRYQIKFIYSGTSPKQRLIEKIINLTN